MDPKVIKEGRLCTAQAVIKQIGADGVALSCVLPGTSLPCFVLLTMEASIAGPWCVLPPILVIFLMKLTGYCAVHILRACVPLEHTKIYLDARDSHDLGRNRPHYCNSIHCPYERRDLWRCGIL